MPHLLASVCGLASLAVAPGPSRAADAPRIVVLITLDGARADLLDHPGRVPSMVGLARRGRSLPLATTPSSITFPATVSLMTGLYPDRSGVADDFASPLGTKPVTLADLFRTAGFRTAAFPSDYLSHARSGIDRGFETFLVVSPSIAADARADSALAFLAGHRGDRAFVWIGFSMLTPQQPWERFRVGGAADSTEYLDRAGSADHAIGRLLDGIAALAPGGETLVVLAGTHGEGIPGWTPPGAPAEEDSLAGHGLELREAELRVPLIFSGAGITGRSGAGDPTQSEWVSTVDVLPTIASLAGIPPPDSLDGASLKPILEGGAPKSRPIFHELALTRTLGWGPRFGVRQGSLKLLSYGGRTSLVRLDALGKGAMAASEVERGKAALKKALEDRFKLEVRLPRGGERDPDFGSEDASMRLLARARERASARTAAEILTPLVARFPNNGPIKIERAMLDVYGRRERTAATLLDSLRKAHPEYVEAEAAYAELLIRFDRTGVAAPRLSSLGGWPMFEVDRLWRLGAAQVLAKLYDDAARTYRLAESIGYPSDARLIQFRDERYQIRRLDAEITSYPDRTVSIIQMALVFGRLGLYDDCYSWLHRARGAASMDAEPEYWLGHYLMEEGRAKHASVAFKRALDKDSTRVDARVELAYAEISLGQKTEALKNLRRAIATGKTDAFADYNLACLLAQDGEIDEAFRSLSRAVEKGYSNRQLIGSDPDLQPLRADPRFQEIVRKLR